MASRRIANFREFLNKKIIESAVKLEIDWWDDCIVEVMQDLAKECYGDLDWTTLVKYVRDKYSILGRDNSDYEEKIVAEHIKDLIFQHHSDSFFNDFMYPLDDDKAKVHSMGLAVDELSKVILTKVREQTTTNPASITGVTSATLSDAESRVMIPMQEIGLENEEDYEQYCDEGVKIVKSVRDYTELLKESKDSCKLVKIESIKERGNKEG